MSRFIGTFILTLLSGIVGLYLGSFINGSEWLGLLLPIATVGGLITYYQAKIEEREDEKMLRERQKEAEKDNPPTGGQ